MAVYIKPEAQGASLGAILAMMKLLDVRKGMGITDIAFAAGLPDAKVPDVVRESLVEAMGRPQSPYIKYDPKSDINEEKLRPAIAEFHNRMYGAEIPVDLIGVSGGSTPIIDACARASTHKGKVALAFSPGYPLIDLSIELEGSRTIRSARLVTSLDINENGQPYQSERWQIDYTSLQSTLDWNRDEATFMYLNFPSNPTGYSPTKEEYIKLAEVLIEDIRQRKTAGLDSMLILEDMAYAEMMHGGVKYYSMFKAIDDMKKDPKYADKLELLGELENSVVVGHSFSKAFSVAGDRVAYFTARNPDLFFAVNNIKTINDLTPARATLAAMKGALTAGEVDHEAMDQYGIRLRMLEEGLNSITTSAVAISGEDLEQTRMVRRYKPVPARADAGFFTTTMFDVLKGQKIDPERVKNLKDQAAKIANPSLRKLFDGIFEGNKVNNVFDATLWLLEHANVCGVPLAQSSKEHLVIRFSVGQTPVTTIRKALDQIQEAFAANLDIAEANRQISR